MKKLLALLLLLLAMPAGAQELATSSGNAVLSPIVNVGMKWQGMGQGMRAAIIGFDASTIRSNSNRTRHYSNVAFRYFRVVIPLFNTIGSLYQDTLLNAAASYSFQVGFEYPYTAANSGLAARVPVTWGGGVARLIAGCLGFSGEIVPHVRLVLLRVGIGCRALNGRHFHKVFRGRQRPGGT